MRVEDIREVKTCARPVPQLLASKRLRANDVTPSQVRASIGETKLVAKLKHPNIVEFMPPAIRKLASDGSLIISIELMDLQCETLEGIGNFSANDSQSVLSMSLQLLIFSHASHHHAAMPSREFLLVVLPL